MLQASVARLGLGLLQGWGAPPPEGGVSLLLGLQGSLESRDAYSALGPAPGPCSVAGAGARLPRAGSQGQQGGCSYYCLQATRTPFLISVTWAEDHQSVVITPFHRWEDRARCCQQTAGTPACLRGGQDPPPSPLAGMPLQGLT